MCGLFEEYCCADRGQREARSLGQRLFTGDSKCVVDFPSSVLLRRRERHRRRPSQAAVLRTIQSCIRYVERYHFQKPVSSGTLDSIGTQRVLQAKAAKEVTDTAIAERTSKTLAGALLGLLTRSRSCSTVWGAQYCTVRSHCRGGHRLSALPDSSPRSSAPNFAERYRRLDSWKKKNIRT